MQIKHLSQFSLPEAARTHTLFFPYYEWAESQVLLPKKGVPSLSLSVSSAFLAPPKNDAAVTGQWAKLRSPFVLVFISLFLSFLYFESIRFSTPVVSCFLSANCKII